MKKIVKIYESDIKRAVRRGLMEKLLLENQTTQAITDRTKAIEDLTNQYKELNDEIAKSQNESTEIDETFLKVPADKLASVKDELPKDATVEITEDDDWMQGVSDEIEKDGTEGTFREWCQNRGYRNGCSSNCIKDALRTNSTKLHYRAGLAHAFCSARK